MNIILCGMPCSGKTYLGKIAAERLSLNFIDTDELIIQKYFKSHGQHVYSPPYSITCRDIVLKEGEPFFRALEREVIEGLKHVQRSIIAIGSGAIAFENNIRYLKQIGELVYLKTPVQMLLERNRNRKPFSSLLDKNNIEKSFELLLQKRIPLYEKHCLHIIDTASEDAIESIKTILSKDVHHGK